MCQMTSLILNFLFYTYLVSKEQKFLCFESKNTKSEMTRKYQCYIIQSNALQITFRPVSFLSIWRKLRLKDILPVANSLNFTTFKLKYKPPLSILVLGNDVFVPGETGWDGLFWQLLQFSCWVTLFYPWNSTQATPRSQQFTTVFQNVCSR